MQPDTRHPEPSAEGALLAQCLRDDDADRDSLLERLCRDHPERAPALRHLYALLDEFGLLDEPVPDEPVLDEPGRLGEPLDPQRIGPYRVLEVLGTGGMGLVYLAEHERLGRRVALKVIHAGLTQAPKARERFQREAAVAARLDHPGICPVYEVGDTDGAPFFAMRFVPGQTLAHAIAQSVAKDQRPVVLPARDGNGTIAAVLRLCEDVAQALHAAHEAGLVHRDVKPGNLMVTPEGAPVLLDFGLARAGDSDDQGLTRTGDELGTPFYMAPEQIAGGPVDRRTDVYALGVTLYECLTLQPPFRAVNRHDLASQILRAEPPDPRRRSGTIGRDLWTVLQSALAKEPERRYATAAAFAEDLRRLRRHEPILARRAGPLLRLQRFVQRHPLAAGFVAFLLLALAGFAVLLQQRGNALVEKDDALRTARANEQALRATAAARTAPAAALEMALQAVATERTVETVSALYAVLAVHHEQLRLLHNDQSPFFADFAADGARIVTCANSGRASAWDRHGEPVGHVKHNQRPGVGARPVNWFEFAPPGAYSDGRFVTASDDGTARILDRDGRQLLVLDHRTRDNQTGAPYPMYDPIAYPEVWRARYSPDSALVATSCTDRLVRIWNAATGDLVGAPLAGHRTPMVQIAWSPQGLLASADDMGNWMAENERFEVRIWRSDSTGFVIAHAVEAPGSIHTLEFAPDGSALVGACHDGTAYLWDLRSNIEAAEPVRLPHDGPVWSATFAGDGHRILTASQDRFARIWTGSGECVAKALHDGPVLRVTFAGGSEQAGEPRILTTSRDQTVRVFDDQLFPLLVLRGHSDLTVTARLSPDGRQVVSTSWDNTARVWDLVDAELPRLLGHRGAVRALGLLPGGRVVSASDDGTSRVWDLATGRSDRLHLAAAPWNLDLSPDGSRMLVGHEDGEVRLYDLTADHVLATYPSQRTQWAIGVLLADGRALVAGREQAWRVFDDSGRFREWEPGTGVTYALARAPERRLVAGAGRYDAVHLWSEAGQVVASIPWPSVAWVHSLGWSPDERRLAAGSANGEAWIWTIPPTLDRDTPSTGEPLQLTGHDGKVLSVAWSPDGQLLAAGVSDGTLHLWRVAGPERIAVLRGHGGAAVHAVLFASNELLLSGGADGAIQTWTTSVDRLIELARQRLPRESSGDESVSEFGVPLRSGRFDEALPIVRRHVERAITHRDAKLLRFIAWQIVAPWQPAAAGHPGLLAQAERAATQAIELAPEPDDAMFATLARVWFCKGDLQQALAWQQKAVDATIPQRTVDRQRHEATLADYWQRLGSGR